MSITNKNIFFLQIACLSGLIAVVLGAFGAHKLKEMVAPGDIAIFETGVRYQFYHTFALFIAGVVMYIKPLPIISKSAYSFMIGILLFSGSLYALALRNISSINLNWLGPITPVGGLFFIVGWLLLFISFKKINQ